MKRQGHLFEQVAEYGSLRAAARRARRGKQARQSVARFMFRLRPNLPALQAELRSGKNRMRPYRTFTIYEPKRRRICAAHFRDRVVHHAVCAAVDPVVENCLVHDPYSCRRGKGTHAVVHRTQQLSRRLRNVLLCDEHRYFDSINQAALEGIWRRKLKDGRVLSLLSWIIRHPFPGNAVGKGVPIGNLTSQYCANLYLGELDHFVKDRLRLPGYVRYMDDMAASADDKPRSHCALAEIRGYLAGALRLELREEGTRRAPVSQGVPYLGFRVFPGVVRVDSLQWTHLRRRVRRREAADPRGALGEEALAESMRGMVGHVCHADTMRARRRLFGSTANMG